MGESSRIKAEIAIGDIDFAGAAEKYSTCSSKERGGKLGKFAPGAMAPEFEEAVFGLYDTGEINPRNDAAVFKPKSEIGEVLGPIKTKNGYHLILVESRFVADFDFRLKEEGVTEI